MIVTIYPGMNRPYYLKNQGKLQGTYIRLGGTSRLADSTKIRELEIEGSNLSWDELTCIGYPVTAEAADKLCRDIRNYRREAADPEGKLSFQEVSIEQLISWKVLKKVVPVF